MLNTAGGNNQLNLEYAKFYKRNDPVSSTNGKKKCNKKKRRRGKKNYRLKEI